MNETRRGDLPGFFMPSSYPPNQAASRPKGGQTAVTAAWNCHRTPAALTTITKEAAQVRRNEFLAATGNPIDMQIIGLEGRAELLREASKALNINPDKVVPSLSVIRQRAAMAQMQMLQQQQGMQPQGNGQELMNGAPVEDQFSPTPQ